MDAYANAVTAPMAVNIDLSKFAVVHKVIHYLDNLTDGTSRLHGLDSPVTRLSGYIEHFLLILRRLSDHCLADDV